MKEKDLLGSIIEQARARRWKVAHFASAPIMRGGRIVWMTPVQADGKGFPDLLMVRERVLAVEVKGGSHKPTVEQSDWLIAMRMAGATTAVWTPREWDDGTVIEELTRRTAAGESTPYPGRNEQHRADPFHAPPEGVL